MPSSLEMLAAAFELCCRCCYLVGRKVVKQPAGMRLVPGARCITRFSQVRDPPLAGGPLRFGPATFGTISQGLGPKRDRGHPRSWRTTIYIPSMRSSMVAGAASHAFRA